MAAERLRAMGRAGPGQGGRGAVGLGEELGIYSVDRGGFKQGGNVSLSEALGGRFVENDFRF